MLYDGEDVMIALGITALLVIFLTAFAFQVNSIICNVSNTDLRLILQTKIDFTLCRGVLACVLFVFVLFGLGIAILPLLGVNIQILHLVYSAIGVLIFSVYLIYDTQVDWYRVIKILQYSGSYKADVSQAFSQIVICLLFA